MCKLKSAIILKDRVFIPDYDSSGDWKFVAVNGKD